MEVLEVEVVAGIVGIEGAAGIVGKVEGVAGIFDMPEGFPRVFVGWIRRVRRCTVAGIVVR